MWREAEGQIPDGKREREGRSRSGRRTSGRRTIRCRCVGNRIRERDIVIVNTTIFNSIVVVASHV